MPQITARDTSTGKTVTFNWNGDGQPTDADMADIFKSATAQGQSPPMDARGTFPGMHRDAPRQSEEDPSAGLQSLNKSLEGVAHPQGLGDFASLLIPSTALGTGYRSLRGYVAAAKPIVTDALASAPKPLQIPGRLIKSAYNAATEAGSAGDRAFQELPLSEQMESLGPVRPNPITTRSGGPIGQEVGTATPFHELPLSQQMEQLPRTGAAPVGRAGSPPLNPQTPFHELPLYQQMEQLSAAPNAVGSQRVGMPQVAPSSDLFTSAGDRLPPDVAARVLAVLKSKLAGQSQ